MKLITAFFMSWGCFCAIPCPVRKWDDAARPLMIVCLPVLGMFLGGLWALCGLLTCRLPQMAAFGATLLAVMFGVGVTVAFLVASSRPVINTFTIGDIQLSLTETTGEQYQLIPGTTISKDPTLTVKAGSDACWLFFVIDASTDLGNYVTYKPAAGWKPVPGMQDAYYRQVEKTDADIAFPLLQDDAIYVKDTVTEEQLSAIKTAPALAFTGYAVQKVELATVEEAWQALFGAEVADR